MILFKKQPWPEPLDLAIFDWLGYRGTAANRVVPSLAIKLISFFHAGMDNGRVEREQNHAGTPLGPRLNLRDFGFIAKGSIKNSEHITSHKQPVAPMAGMLLKYARSSEL